MKDLEPVFWHLLQVMLSLLVLGLSWTFSQEIQGTWGKGFPHSLEVERHSVGTCPILGRLQLPPSLLAPHLLTTWLSRESVWKCPSLSPVVWARGLLPRLLSLWKALPKSLSSWPRALRMMDWLAKEVASPNFFLYLSESSVGATDPHPPRMAVVGHSLKWAGHQAGMKDRPASPCRTPLSAPGAPVSCFRVEEKGWWQWCQLCPDGRLLLKRDPAPLCRGGDGASHSRF